MSKEIKAFPFEFKLNKSKRTLEGYASTFGNRDLVGDIVEPGAFNKTIKERGPKIGEDNKVKSKIKLLWQHDPWQPLGVPVRMSEDSKGLNVEAQISETTLGNDAMILIDDGALDSLSIGYDVVKDEFKSETNTRHLKEVKLYEFSLVTFPANEDATLKSMKSMSHLENLLKKAGVADVTMLLKEGRKLSSNNEQLIRNAIEALEAVLDMGEPEEDDEETASKSTRRDGKEPLDINLGYDLEELKAIAENFRLK